MKMILSPLMPYGMGLESLDEVGYEICIRQGEVFPFLCEAGRPPQTVSDDFVELLVWKKIFTCCGTSATLTCLIPRPLLI